MPGINPWIATALILASTASAQAADDPVAREVERLDRACNVAYAHNDLQPYFACYRADAVLIFYDYRTTVADYHRSWSESVHSGNRVTKFDMAEVVVRVLPGGSTAIVSYRAGVANHYADGHDTTEQGYETDVWVRRDQQWKMEHVQYSLAAPPPP
jgi:ketosteroid isomerase-like protein